MDYGVSKEPSMGALAVKMGVRGRAQGATRQARAQE